MPNIAIIDIDPIGTSGQHCHAKVSIDGHIEYLTIAKMEAGAPGGFAPPRI